MNSDTRNKLEMFFSPWRTFRGKEWSGVSINIDAKRFYGCKFYNCELIFSGDIRYLSIEDCEFDGCRWKMIGHAAQTLSLIKKLFAQCPEMKDLTFPSTPKEQV